MGWPDAWEVSTQDMYVGEWLDAPTSPSASRSTAHGLVEWWTSSAAQDSRISLDPPLNSFVIQGRWLRLAEPQFCGYTMEQLRALPVRS